MKRALELTGGLSGEKTRWRESSERLKHLVTGLLGDMLLAVGYLSYMGAFTSTYRDKILNTMWVPLLKQFNVPCSTEFSLVECLSSEL
jgi:dynein heavy chain